METLRKLALDIWVGEQPQRFLGAELGTRMTVIRLANGACLFTRLSIWTKFALALDGGLHGPAVPRTFRMMLRFKKGQCRPLLSRILQWDFDRIVLAHGEPITRDAKSIFVTAWSFVQPLG
jgi:hypothetical protein